MTDPAKPAPITQGVAAKRVSRLDWAQVRAGAVSRWWVAVGVGLAWLTWPYPSVQVSGRIDPSWAVALHFAVSRGLDFGHDILFTYGPLGFLSQPLLVTTPTAILAFTFAVVAQVVLCVVVLRSALRSYPWWAAVLLTYAVGAILAATGFSNLGDYVVLLVAVLALRVAEADSPPPVWIAPAGGVVAAFQLLVKVNGGIVCLALLALVVWRCRPGGWRSEALLAAGFAAALTVLWVASRNSLTALPEWARQSFHVVASYTDAMALEASNSGEYLQAGLLLLVAAALVAWRVRALDRARGFALGGVAAVFAFAYVKEGFIRHDAIHSSLFFAALAVGLLAIRWDVHARWVAAAVILASVGAVATAVGSGAFFYRTSGRVGNAVHETALIVDGSRRQRAYSDSRSRLRRLLALDPSTLRRLRGHTVDVEPYETDAVWAYGFDWRPERFIQSYMATDHELDEFNAHGLAAHGAERILRHREPFAIDDKHPEYLAPESYLVLVCRYRQLHVDGNWEVLGRANDRCGTSRPLGSVVARAGEAVAVPAAPNPSDVVYARIHVDKTLKQRVAFVLLKPLHTPEIVVGSKTYRLVADTARGPLIMRMPHRAGIAAGFGGELDYASLTLENVPSPYRVTFYAVPLSQR